MNVSYIFQFVVNNVDTFKDLGNEVTDVYRVLEKLYNDFNDGMKSGYRNEAAYRMERQIAMRSASKDPAVAKLLAGINEVELGDRNWGQKIKDRFVKPRTRGFSEILTLLIALWPLIKQIIDALQKDEA